VQPYLPDAQMAIIRRLMLDSRVVDIRML